jgi:hypothetical protein
MKLSELEDVADGMALLEALNSVKMQASVRIIET